RQLLANDGLPGSAPYMSRIFFDSRDRSINSGALDCIRYAISNELIRVAISGSPVTPSRFSLRALSVSRESRWVFGSIPGGCERNGTGSPAERNSTPLCTVGRNPQPQLDCPPLGPLLPEEKTTKPGRSRDSLPSPYVTHDPMLGRPNCCEPVFMKIWAGAWLNASVTIDLTIAM